MAVGEKTVELVAHAATRELHTHENAAGLIGLDALFLQREGSQ